MLAVTDGAEVTPDPGCIPSAAATPMFITMRLYIGRGANPMVRITCARITRDLDRVLVPDCRSCSNRTSGTRRGFGTWSEPIRCLAGLPAHSRLRRNPYPRRGLCTTARPNDLHRITLRSVWVIVCCKRVWWDEATACPTCIVAAAVLRYRPLLV